MFTGIFFVGFFYVYNKSFLLILSNRKVDIIIVILQMDKLRQRDKSDLPKVRWELSGRVKVTEAS